MGSVDSLAFESLDQVLEIIDQVNVLSPRGWSDVEIDIARRPGDRLEVALHHRFVAGGPGATVAHDPALRSMWLADALDALAEKLGVAAGRIEIAKASGAIELRYVRDGDVCARIALAPEDLEELFYTDRVLDEVANSARRVASGDAWSLGASRWDFDYEQQQLVFRIDGLERRVRAGIIGTWGRGDANPGTILWSWANRDLVARIPAAVREQAERAREEAGLEILRAADPILCEEPLAHELARFAADRSGAVGMYAALSRGALRMFIGLFEPA
jgi:hypothetical protein